MTRNKRIGWAVGISLLTFLASIPVLMTDYAALGLIMLLIGLMGSTVLPLFLELEITSIPVGLWHTQALKRELIAEAKILEVEDATGRSITMAHLRRWS